ncbi:MAG: hypothetical protein WCP21_21220 [Armatimonadota bacterium]
MQPCDYSRSFITFSVPGNNARIQVEARCLLTQPDGAAEQFLMFASCKSEDTYAENELFRNPETSPNYDFSGMYGDERYSLSRLPVAADTAQLETGLTAQRFTGLTRHVHEAAAEPLLSKEAIIDATLAHRIVLARNEITDPATGVTQLLEYPVKTMNVHPETGQFQVDTGPVPMYDFSDPSEDVMARFRWAYAACNDFAKVWFVILAPTPMIRDGVEVARAWHYQQMANFPQSRNTYYALEG